MSGLNLPHYILEAKHRLSSDRDALCAAQGQLAGDALAQSLAELYDELVCGLFDRAVQEAPQEHQEPLATTIAVVPIGGYGRRSSSPHSDIDLMLLCRDPEGEAVRWLAGRLLRDIGDLGVSVGHSLRSVNHACRLALEDAVTATSLMESRLLVGSETLFQEFQGEFTRAMRRNARRMLAAVVAARQQERQKYGGTVYVLEPNIKRTPGGLRDLHLIRWVSFLQHGTPDFTQSVTDGLLSQADAETLVTSREFLLRVRHQMHFHARRSQDSFDRAEQWRIAEAWQIPQVGSLLPVEVLMQDYFRHTAAVACLADLFVELPKRRRWVEVVSERFLTQRLPEGVIIGPTAISVDPGLIDQTVRSPAGLIRLSKVSCQQNKPISRETIWEVRRSPGSSGGLTQPAERTELDPQAIADFVEILDCTEGLERTLRQLHQWHLLEYLIPEFAPLRGLLQFNASHQFTVDEHSLLAVKKATDFAGLSSELGDLYRGLKSKWLLHLAILIHDIGKGHEEDHCQRGARFARTIARRLMLTSQETETLVFLVENQLLMAHLAFRRDIADERVRLNFAVRVGTPERLSLLFLLTVADRSAVAAGMWNRWQEEVLLRLYRRVMVHLSADRDPLDPESHLEQIREEIRTHLGKPLPPWLHRQVDALSAIYLHSAKPAQLAEELRQLASRPADKVKAVGQADPATGTTLYTLSTDESVISGIFHRLVGALAAKSQSVLSAEIHTLDLPDWPSPQDQTPFDELSSPSIATEPCPDSARSKTLADWQNLAGGNLAGQSTTASGDGQERVEDAGGQPPRPLVLDRFLVRDLNYPAGSPPERIEAVCRALTEALLNPQPLSLSQPRRYGQSAGTKELSTLPTVVRVDNSTSDRYTILDIFTGDRPGLLYAVGRTLIELGLEIALAKISTYMDQVVDVFYVTDRDGSKILQTQRLQAIEGYLLERLDAFKQQPVEVWASEAPLPPPDALAPHPGPNCSATQADCPDQLSARS